MNLQTNVAFYIHLEHFTLINPGWLNHLISTQHLILILVSNCDFSILVTTRDFLNMQVQNSAITASAFVDSLGYAFIVCDFKAI